jgi:hypothetical protein
MRPPAGASRRRRSVPEALERDNAKSTFDAHRSAYEEALLEPARFSSSLGAELQRRV